MNQPKKRINFALNKGLKNSSKLNIIIKVIPKKKERGLKNNPATKDKIRVKKTIDLYFLRGKSFIRKTTIPTAKSVIYFDDVK